MYPAYRVLCILLVWLVAALASAQQGAPQASAASQSAAASLQDYFHELIAFRTEPDPRKAGKTHEVATPLGMFDSQRQCESALLQRSFAAKPDIRLACIRGGPANYDLTRGSGKSRTSVAAFRSRQACELEREVRKAKEPTVQFSCVPGIGVITF